MIASLRHLRLFLSAVDSGTLTAAAEAWGVTQPAVTHALHRMEVAAGGALLDRGQTGVCPTRRGEVLAGRIRRALAILDTTLRDIAPRLVRRVTAAQLRAVIATTDAGNFALAARRLGVAQPTVFRAVTGVEQEAGRPLFDRRAQGLAPSRAALSLARAARLTFAELAQAEADLAELDGLTAGAVVLGALPLSRSALLPEALAGFRALRPATTVTVLDGSYDSLLDQLRGGEIDILLGALRHPAPIGDLRQEPLFEDGLVFVCAAGHPLAARRGLRLADLAGQGWIVPRRGSPSRAAFDSLCDSAGIVPAGVIESGSILLMRELMDRSGLIGCISAAQAASELQRGLVTRLDIGGTARTRPIGLTMRGGWQPTAAQSDMLTCLRRAGGHLAEGASA